MMQQGDELLLPIDIQIGKLQDWLASRRHVNHGWQSKVLEIRKKINNAIQDMPAHPDITRLLSGTYINYFHCQKIVEILKETEKDSRNFLGYYSSQRMKDWQEVVRMYEKENLYLAEAAQILARTIQYDIPSLRKQIAKCEQIQQECERKETEYEKSKESLRSQYQKSCKQMGIPGENIRKELVDLVTGLPVTLDALAKDSKSFKEAVAYYAAMVEFTLRGPPPTPCLPLLSYIMEHGNVTTYEWRYGEPPLSIEEPHLELPDEEVMRGNTETNNDEGEIDFGGIDAPDSLGEDAGLQVGEIDWGLVSVEGDGSGDALGIDWEVVVETKEITVEEQGMEGGVARDSEALALLDNPTTRGIFLDELYELEMFLVQRLQELQSEGSVVALSQFQSAPQIVQMQSQANVEKMLCQVKDLIARLTNTQIQHLFRIKSSPRYVEQLRKSLVQRLELAEKMEEMIKAVQERSLKSSKEHAVLLPQLSVILQKTSDFQRQIEEEISKKYKGRPVHLMGGVTAS